jgi:tetratricopeptide (TPR) repeat protein
VTAQLAFALAVLLASGASVAYEEEPQLPQGEWLLLEGRTKDALAWYRARYADDRGAAAREGLAEALVARAADLLAQHRTVEAQRLLDEAKELTQDPARAQRIGHLTAYGEELTTGHAIRRGNTALALGDLGGARTGYERALESARDAFERRQSQTLLGLLTLIEALLQEGGEPAVGAAVEVWPGDGASREDVQQFLRAARASPTLMGEVGRAARAAPAGASEQPPILRGVALCLLLRTREARELLGDVAPARREPLEALLVQAERLERTR